MGAFLAGVMRSLKAEHWRRVQRGQDCPVAARGREEGDEHREVEQRDPRPDPERALAARQEVAAIEQLFADDPVVLQIINGLAAGLSTTIRHASGCGVSCCGRD
jgi:hypothetical protein